MRNIRKRWWLVAAAALLLLFLDVAMYIQIKEYYPDFMKQEEASTPVTGQGLDACLLYTSPSPRDRSLSRMPSSA